MRLAVHLERRRPPGCRGQSGCRPACRSPRRDSVRLAGDRHQRRRRALPRRRQLDAHVVRPGRPIDQRDEGRRAVEHREAGSRPSCCARSSRGRRRDSVTVTARRRRSSTRQRFLAGLRGQRAAVGALGASAPSTCRSYSRTRYDPGVHTAMISSTCGRPPVGIHGLDLEVVRVRRREAERVANRIGTLGGRRCGPMAVMRVRSSANAKRVQAERSMRRYCRGAGANAVSSRGLAMSASR